MNTSWLTTAAKWATDGKKFVLVTVMGVRGSAPCAVGQRMLVGLTQQHGTVGGGRLEQEVLDNARAGLTGDAGFGNLGALALGARLGQCCGGKVIVHYELVEQALAPVVVFGAGHVGQELVRILARLPNKIVCIDSRPQWLAKLPALDTVETRLEQDPVETVRTVQPDSVCLVLTHRHDLDLELCRALLARTDLAMVGVIGSQSKAIRFRRELSARGLAADRLVCPVGEPTSKHPAAVAISMAARVCKDLAEPQVGQQTASSAALRLLNALAQEETEAHANLPACHARKVLGEDEFTKND